MLERESSSVSLELSFEELVLIEDILSEYVNYGSESPGIDDSRFNEAHKLWHKVGGLLLEIRDPS